VKVRYLPLSPTLASFRLRSIIPAKYLKAHGIEPVLGGRSDWVILQKHDWPDGVEKGASRVLFDVCDDYFGKEHDAHYRKWCERADVITCNSVTMAEVIKRETGRDAVVIDDPYESGEFEPKCHAPALWFGNQRNMVDLLPIIGKVGRLVICTDLKHPEVLEWSPEAMERAWTACGITVLPTGLSMAKSANRAIESIRRGIYPVCGRLPAYQELGLGSDDIPAEVHERLQNPEWTVATVARLQNVIRDRFSPETVGRKWLECLSSI
jgi:hypothetical protein